MSLWGHLADRYATGPAPRKLLALDGGGIRGVITLEILAELERKLAAQTGAGDEFRLCHFFDYIGGTSTGAIIATGLARGMTVSDLLDFYKEAGPEMFDRSSIFRRLRSLYRRKPLARKLQQVYGEDTTLFPEHLRCLLLIVTQNVTTDSPWLISSNPLARYNDPERPDCNLKIPLWQLVRASTAAPVYFPPEVFKLDPDDPSKSFVFVDGGVSPYNNPAFLIYRMATDAAYKLCWDSGEDKMLLVSVGTGAAANDAGYATNRNILSNAKQIPGNLMYAMLVNQDINCRTVGRCTYGAKIDNELDDMIPRDDAGVPIPLPTDLGRRFLYARYNVDLTREGLDQLAEEATDPSLAKIDPQTVQKLDSVSNISALSAIGRAAGQRVDLTHFGPFVN